MNKSESTKLITAAIISVMQAVKGIDKSLTVGTGNSSYKGVSDKDVKEVIGKAMQANGLCLLPTDVEPTCQIDRWTETGGQWGDKQKQQIFTSVKTKYVLMHTSGEWIELSGYGHGVDTQDKAAGKASTYALKYTLLYTFMVPTGKIDDADNHPSDAAETPPNGKATKAATNGTNGSNQTNGAQSGAPVTEKAWLNKGTKEWTDAITSLETHKQTPGGKDITVDMICKKYKVRKEDKALLEAAEKKGKEVAA